jgi:hypothetical protein
MCELIAARTWLTVFQLPAYAPELNPVEGRHAPRLGVLGVAELEGDHDF